MAGLNFDMSQYEPDAGGFGDPVPEGWYILMVDESSVEPTKDNSTTGGFYAKLRFAIQDGPFKGRKLFKNFNIKNQNPQAEEIGRKQLTAVGHAVGVPNCTDTQQLHGVPLRGKVKIEKGTPKPDGTGNYPDKNEITTFKHINEAVPEGGAAEAASNAPVNPFAKGTAAAPAAAPAFAAPPATGAAAPTVAPPAFKPPPPAAAPAAPAAPVFPPEGWIAHPQAPGYFYKGQEVKSEADLRAMVAPAAPAAPVVPAAPPAAAAPAAAAANPAQGAAPPWAR